MFPRALIPFFLGLFMMVTMNILVLVKSFVFLVYDWVGGGGGVIAKKIKCRSPAFSFPVCWL